MKGWKKARGKLRPTRFGFEDRANLWKMSCDSCGTLLALFGIRHCYKYSLSFISKHLSNVSPFCSLLIFLIFRLSMWIFSLIPLVPGLPKTLLQKIQIDPRHCRGWFRWINRLLAHIPRLKGYFVFWNTIFKSLSSTYLPSLKGSCEISEQSTQCVFSLTHGVAKPANNLSQINLPSDATASSSNLWDPFLDRERIKTATKILDSAPWGVTIFLKSSFPSRNVRYSRLRRSLCERLDGSILSLWLREL